MRSVSLVVVLAGSMVLTACNDRLNFSSPAVESRQSIVLPPVEVLPSMKTKSGTCSVSGEQVLSCLSCASTLPVQPPPLLSRKAQELLEIMTAACSVANKSDSSGYIPPSKDLLLRRLIQCSPSAYPDTAFSGTQAATIYSLLNDSIAQQKAFGGLYYNSASTDFETYFGLEIAEARNTLCRGQASIGTGGVYPKEYYDALYNGSNYSLPVVYQRAQAIRNNLRNCMAQSLSNPNRNQQPATPGTTCSYEYVEGEMSSLIIEKVDGWQREGLQVSFEGFGQCGVMTNPRNHLEKPGIIKVAAKKCH